MDPAETLLRFRVQQGDSTQGDTLMTRGVNVSAGGGLGSIELYSEMFDIPPASASIGGAAYDSPVGIIPPFGGMVVAGIISAALILSPASSSDTWPTLEITIAPTADIAPGQGATMDLRAAYEGLRRQMLSEGIPFLNADELEREINDRKGSRI